MAMAMQQISPVAHLPLVLGVLRKLNVAALIDIFCPPRPAHVLSCGRGVEALLLAMLDGHHAHLRGLSAVSSIGAPVVGPRRHQGQPQGACRSAVPPLARSASRYELIAAYAPRKKSPLHTFFAPSNDPQVPRTAGTPYYCTRSAIYPRA